MKVKELIKLLNKHYPEKNVYIGESELNYMRVLFVSGSNYEDETEIEIPNIYKLEE